MALTTAMFTGLTGLQANQMKIDTVGDNIANVNTTAFKANRANFENQLALTMSAGTAPGPTTGGTNPLQVGLGTLVGTVQRNSQPGAIETTGVPTDLAVEGNGFFVVRASSQQQAFTRDGTFQLNADNVLTSADGFAVQGYGVDSGFDVVPGTLQDLQIPLGTLTAVQATTQASYDGNLNADGAVATQGTILRSQALQDATGAAAATGTLLTQLVDPAAPATPLFAENDVITIAKAQKGGRQLPESSFTVTAQSTLGEFLTTLENTMGINKDSTLPDTPGIRVSDATDPQGAGSIIVEGNRGTENALALELNAIRGTNSSFPAPFRFSQTQAADGESVYTSFIAYDSLGTPVHVDLTVVLEQRSDAGNTWRFYAESPDDTDASGVLGTTGTVTFDGDGAVANVTSGQLAIDRQDTGAVTPLQLTLDFSGVTGLTTEASTLVMTTQDGFGAGTLSGFTVGRDGIISGSFSNGLTRSLGQLALATFTNTEGLVAQVNNLYVSGPNSGEPIITAPGTLGAGRILGGALELSNVDLTREFIGLITATTGFSASGRVISTANDLLNELLLIAR